MCGAWLLLEHLRLWRSWAADPSSPLNGVADLDRIALVGHSRGGEAVATAAAFDGMERYPGDARVIFDAGFGIDAVVAIAPTDGMYQPGGRATQLEDTSYLAVHGGRDGDVFWFAGLGQLERASFSGDRVGVKAAVWLPNANHAQFNTLWGRRDYSGLPGAVLDTREVMPPQDQRAAAGSVTAAFLDATLRDDRNRLAMLQDRSSPAWADAGDVIIRYSDSSEVTVAGFAEDVDPATGTLPGTVLDGTDLTVWREEPVPQRYGGVLGNAVALGWSRAAGERPPVFRITLPAGYVLPDDAVVSVTLADSGAPASGTGSAAQEPIDLTVEAVDSSGRTLEVFLGDDGGVPVAPRPHRFKEPLPEWASAAEPLGQTFRLPMTRGGGPPAFDPDELREIRLVFDGTPEGLVWLQNVSVATGS